MIEEVELAKSHAALPFENIRENWHFVHDMAWPVKKVPDNILMVVPNTLIPAENLNSTWVYAQAGSADLHQVDSKQSQIVQNTRYLCQ